MAERTKYILDEADLPAQWYNVVPDLPEPPPPPLHPREEKVILTALCGHAHLDLPAYGAYLAGDMVDNELPDAALEKSLAALP